jgi:hypothetical protein
MGGIGGMFTITFIGPMGIIGPIGPIISMGSSSNTFLWDGSNWS